MPRIFRPSPAGRLLLLAALLGAIPAGAADTLADRLSALATSHGFRVEGIEKIGVEAAVSAEGGLASQLRLLLAGYNHVVDGVPPSVQRVIILGAKVPAARGMVAATTRNAGQHLVTARLQGIGGRRADAALIVDTGASTLVLPDSMMASLGFRAEDLDDRRGQTVNGIVTGKAARLTSVKVGDAVARDVAVLFVADDRLGGVSLLGMSFLDRFSITIDKNDNTLLLMPR